MVSGLEIIENAISQEYADCILLQLPRAILQHIDVQEQTSVSGESDEGTASLQLHYFSPLPEFVTMVSEDVIPCTWKDQVWQGLDCNSSIVQLYKPGEGIRWHVDLAAFGDGVAILSLLSPVVMRFRLVNDHTQIKDVLLKPLSLLLCSGEARYDWEHTIAAASSDCINGETIHRQTRISVTMRRISHQGMA